MLSVVILGTGNLAMHLYRAFSKSSGVRVVQVVGRNPESLRSFSSHVATTSDYAFIKDADVYLIAVKDDAINEVSHHLDGKKGVVAHTSGTVEMDALAPKNRGVFYPLQTFTKGKHIDFEKVPICIEAKEEQSLTLLKSLALTLSRNVHVVDSEQRKKLHLAAVFVSNFTNYLYGIGEEICRKERLSFDLLKPLIVETAEKIQSMSPKEAQTGPARRNDQKSMQDHLKLLDNDKHIALYNLMSEAIKQVYEEKL